LTKKNPIVIGIDDAPFIFSNMPPLDKKNRNATVPVIGATCKGLHLVGLDRTQVYIDGRDATDQVQKMLQSSKHLKEIQYILLDGVALGGFNLVDCEALYTVLRIPIITFSVKNPDLPSMKAALQKHFLDAEERIAILDRIGSPEEIDVDIGLGPNVIYFKPFGTTVATAKDLLRVLCKRSKVPEPLRLAHLIASVL
jgi:endonuclease V-like protein UPF0215 family